jgi:hypothetical protein
MSLQDDITQLNTLGSKAAGHLIRHDDWNSLVSAVTDIAQATKTLVDANLVNRVATLETTVTALGASVAGIDTRLKAVEASISPLLQNYLVTLQTSKANYAVGEIAELTVKVSNLQGQLVSPRPWVDFVCTWGKLRAVAGFATSQVGEGSNSLSVQVNDQGIAKVQLSGGVVSTASAAEEASVHTMMLSFTDNAQQTVADAIMQAPTPGDVRAQSAFKVMSREYERASTGAWAMYANAAYAQYGGATMAEVGEWSNHYSTVVAFARPDGDPLTPDGSRGAASIQANFRNWIASWGGHHIHDTGGLVGTLSDGYLHIIDAELESPLDSLLHRVKGDLVDKVSWGREKYIVAAKSALDIVAATGKPGTKEKATQAGFAMAAQAASEGITLVGVTANAQQGIPVMESHVALAKGTQTVADKVSAVEVVAQQAKGLSTSVSVLEGRMQSTEQLGAKIQGSLQLINENVRGINALDETSLKGGVQKISAEIALIKAKLG